jgi:hypothetical protein
MLGFLLREKIRLRCSGDALLMVHYELPDGDLMTDPCLTEVRVYY